MTQQEWFLKRNCSLSPRQLALAYVVLLVMSLTVAAVFTLRGAWQVFLFSLVEMTAVAIAFLHYARHATDHEHIALTDGCLLVEQVQAGEVRQTRLDPHWTRIALPSRSQDLICLESRGVRIEVGRFINAGKRREVAQELRQGLRYRSLTADVALR